MVRAIGSYPIGRGFKSNFRYHPRDPSLGIFGPLVKRLRHRPFTAVTGVRFSYGSPKKSLVATQRGFSVTCAPGVHVSERLHAVQALIYIPENSIARKYNMIHFESDYIAGAHPTLLRRLTETNPECLSGYGSDPYTASAKKKIALACGNPDYDVELLMGGTQTNAIVISTVLRDWQGVISPETGHINCHEAGAIEYTGHKVIGLPATEGKLSADTVSHYLEDYYADDNREHMVAPGMVYISHPTEYGTLYTKEELTALHRVCRAYDIPLFMDGARLGYGLASPASDMTLPDIAALCDVFYIGGTKVGALCGEAVVFTRGNRPPHFLSAVKRRGALSAKGRLVGIQFDALFTDGLYFEISRHAMKQAMRLKGILEKKGYPFFIDSPTNQQFIVVDNARLKVLGAQVGYSFWEKYDEDHTVIRLAASWSTTDEDLDRLEAVLP